MIHILILNLDGISYTLPAIRAVLKSDYKNFRIYVLDNGSDKNEIPRIKKFFQKEKRIQYFRSKKNLGFAGGNNFLMGKVLPKAKKHDLVLLLNNDTEISKTLLATVSKAPDFKSKVEMIAVKMAKMSNKKTIDNLGLKVFKSGLSANRKTPASPLFGPSGGCAIYTANLLKEVKKKTGDWFDPDYFCYAEDADLAFRALLLGFKPKYVETICYHKVSATAGYGFNKFKMYHTLRNSAFNMIKNMPAGLLLLYLPQIIAFNLLLISRYLPTRKAFTLLRVYGSLLIAFPSLLKKRRKVSSARSLSVRELKKYFTRGMFD